jgi:hypothetical protein
MARTGYFSSVRIGEAARVLTRAAEPLMMMMMMMVMNLN